MGTDPAETDTQLEAILADLPAFAGAAATVEALTAVVALAELPPVLRRMCADHGSPKVRFNAERALRQIPPGPPPVDLGDPPDRKKVAAALKDPDPEVRLAAISAFPLLDETTARSLLLRTLSRGETDSWVLATQLALAGELGGEGMAEHATLHLDHPSPRVEANALHALHRLVPRTALHAAYARLDSPDNRVRGNAVLALFPYNPEIAWRNVREMALARDPWMRASACFLAATLGHEEAERLLLEVLRREKHPELILRVVRWLETRGTQAAAGALKFLIEEGHPALAQLAGRALAAIRARTTLGDHDLEAASKAFARRRDGSLPGAVVRRADTGAPAGLAGAGGSSPGATPGAPSLFEPPELVAELVGDLESPAGSSPLEAVIENSLRLLRYADGEKAVELLQDEIPEDGGQVPPRLRTLLALALISIGEVGLAGREVDKLDTDEVPLAELYALARALEEMGSHAGAARVYEGIRARRLAYRDVRERLEGLAASPGAMEDRVRVALSKDYRDLELLGRGGMGQVFRAVHRVSGDTVALKVPDHRLLLDAVTLERFHRECETLARVQHPNVIRVLEVGQGEVPYLAMELLTGRSLEEDLRVAAPFPIDEAMALMGPVARALEVVHAAGIVHRDLKPANILMDEDGSPRLADFGVAFTDQQAALTNTGMMVGTVGYMAPEQIAGDVPSPAADVYAYGVTLFEALTGELPFDGANSMLKIYRDAPRITERAPVVPEAFADLVAACLDRDPARRPADGAALTRELEALGH